MGGWINVVLELYIRLQTIFSDLLFKKTLGTLLRNIKPWTQMTRKAPEIVAPLYRHHYVYTTTNWTSTSPFYTVDMFCGHPEHICQMFVLEPRTLWSWVRWLILSATMAQLISRIVGDMYCCNFYLQLLG